MEASSERTATLDVENPQGSVEQMLQGLLRTGEGSGSDEGSEGSEERKTSKQAGKPKAKPKDDAESESEEEEEGAAWNDDEEGGSPESESDAEEEPESETDEEGDAEGEGDEDDGLPKGAQKRINKLTKKVKATEEENERLKERLQELSQKQPEESEAPAQAASGDPLTHVESEKDLQALERNAKQGQRLIEEYLDDALEGQQRQQFEAWAKEHGLWDAENEEPDKRQLKRTKYQFADMLQEQIPSKRKLLAETEKWNKEAERIYPWLAKKDSKEAAMVKNLESKLPAIKQFSSHRLWLARMVRGYQEELKEQQQEGKPPVKKGPRQKPPKQPTSPSTAPPERKPKRKSEELREKALGSRDPEEVQSWATESIKESLLAGKEE